MKRWLNRQTIIAFILGIVICGAIPVHAAIEEFILYKTNYHLVIDGKEYKDDNLPLLSYKGYTYAPVRSVFKAAGMDIKWDSTKGEALVTTVTATSITTTSSITPAPEQTQPTVQQASPQVATPSAVVQKTRNEFQVIKCDKCPYCRSDVTNGTGIIVKEGSQEFMVHNCYCVNQKCSMWGRQVGINKYRIEYN